MTVPLLVENFGFELDLEPSFGKISLQTLQCDINSCFYHFSTLLTHSITLFFVDSHFHFKTFFKCLKVERGNGKTRHSLFVCQHTAVVCKQTADMVRQILNGTSIEVLNLGLTLEGGSSMEPRELQIGWEK